MRCPACDVEVAELAVYCHKCGQRLDEGSRAGGAAPAASSPSQKFQQAAATARNGATDPEEPVWQGGYSFKAMIGAWIATGLLTLAVLAVGIVWVRDGTYWFALAALIVLAWLYQFAVLAYRRWNVKYMLTTRRLIHETGILRRLTDRIEAIDIDDVTLEQGIVERFLGVGTVRITSSDRTHPELLLRGIDDARRIAGLLDDVRLSERRRRGLHIEHV